MNKPATWDTADEVEKEIKKCADSPYYFATTYLTVTNENGEKAPFTTTFSEDVFNKIFKEITIHGR
jgi:hypothetical protein